MKTLIHSNARRGFTLIELLTVIAIIGILAAILIPTVGRVREQAKRAKCMSNVRQLTVSLVNAANQNKGQTFPKNAIPAPAPDGRAWAWDVAHALANEMVNTAGREAFYCPSSRMLNENEPERMWAFGGNLNSFAVSGYVLLVTGTKQITGEYLNDRVRSEYTQTVPARQIPASRRPLVVDAVISANASVSSFENAGGGLPVNVSNHMQGTMPMGAHTGYVDGHVKWRAFERASSTNPDGFDMRNNSGTPRFWF